MELREFAERVLFATSLEEKLQTPDAVTDEFPGSPIITPSTPGRPSHLLFKPTGTARGEFPGTRQLEQNHERGRLLHFFANHELLATELMALVLLKFPDAPAAFRKGVFETLKDEQEHTRLYLKRMQACDMEFGSIPVSGYFWRAVAGMESPMDYVAGLSLTFEQANLDFARHFSSCFAEVGDADSAGLLNKIYRDEIGHVAYGLKWFRRWKNPDENDWDAFCRQLKFPLSPARAKGFSLNFEGRRAAGLTPEFIENLNVFSQSKGRTPTVFLFNPLAEARIAGGPGFSATKKQQQLALDLETLPMFLCRQDDIVLVRQKPAVHFLSPLKAAGFPLPEFADRVPPLSERKLGGLRPWAWSPDSVELLRPLFPKLTVTNQTPADVFNERLTVLFSKAWSADFLRRFLQSHEPAPFLISADEVGIAARTVSAAMDAIVNFRQRGFSRLVLKDSIGVAGANAIRLFEPDLLETQQRWIANVIAAGREIVVEPWLDRVLDFSVQLEMSASGLKLCGYTGLWNDARGQFIGNWAEPKFDKTFPVGVSAALNLAPRGAFLIQSLFADLFEALAGDLRSLGFSGPLGIDCFVYRDASGVPKLKPVVEINPRYTMGRVTVELMKRVAPGGFGAFRLINQPALRATDFPNFKAYAENERRKFPLLLEGSPTARIREGFVCLTDAEQATGCLACFQVSRIAPPSTQAHGHDHVEERPVDL